MTNWYKRDGSLVDAEVEVLKPGETAQRSVRQTCFLKEFYGKLPDEKIKINWNKNPVKMALFLGFLKVPVIKSKKHLGACNGWTLYENDQLNLRITGGIVNGSEWLDNIQFGKKLSNPYNNYVNPFYLWEVMTKDGLEFFIEYYEDEITKRIEELSKKIKNIKTNLNDLESLYNKIIHRTGPAVRLPGWDPGTDEVTN